MTHPARPLEVRREPGRPPHLVADTGGAPVAWTARHAGALRATVAAHGAVAVRGLGLHDETGVAAAFHALAPGGLLPEREAFAPRPVVAPGVHGSTPWPASQPMCAHPEFSYGAAFPATMMFACLRAPGSGGATVLADAAAVLRALPADLVSRCERDGWLLERTYSEDVGSSWAQAFGTDDPRAVEHYCRTHAIEATWTAGGTLRTRQRRPAVVRHPLTGVACWFNQIAYLSEHTLDEEVREFLADTHGPDALPFTTRFGDGTPIGPEVVALINAVTERHLVREEATAGDLLLVDNVRTAHGRDAYAGDRTVLVGMADPVPAGGRGAQPVRSTTMTTPPVVQVT